MNKPSESSASATPQAAELRRRAEAITREAATQAPKRVTDPSPEETQQILHELRVHQIELEMQNEELRRTGVELDASRACYFDLYDLAPTGYVTISKPGLILEANLTATTLLGVDRGVLVGRPISPFILKEDQDLYYLHRKRLFDTGEPQIFELRMVRRDGTVFWARLDSVAKDFATGSGPDADGAWAGDFDLDDEFPVGRRSEVSEGMTFPGLPTCRVVISDITQRKQAEVALRKHEVQLRATLEATADGILGVDNQGKVIHASRRFAEVWRIPKSLMDLGDDSALLAFVLDQLADPDAFLKKVQLLYSSDAVDVDTLACKDGRMVERFSLPMILDGTLLGRVWSFRDVTERKQAEEALARAAVVLGQSNEEVRQFAYIVSHDLRAPLVNIGGFATELRRSLADLDRLIQPVIEQLGETEGASTDRILRRDVPEALGFINASVSRMDHLIDSVLRLSHAGHHDLVPERLDLGSLVSEIVASLGTQIEARGAIVWVLPLPEVVADRTSLEQILSNILTNAILYLDPTRRGRIEVTGELSGTELFMKISDNGRGIAPDDREAVFAPFRRAGAPDVPGEGIGLAYVQALVRRQGGRIWFDSEPGVGTTFTFTLPVVRP
jgi:PAS domain S-box-containing protein